MSKADTLVQETAVLTLTNTQEDCELLLYKYYLTSWMVGLSFFSTK